MSERLAVGAGGSAAARVSVDHPLAVDALVRLGRFLDWHGGLTLDYFHQDGSPHFIECNPRIVEPGNAAAAGVDLPMLMSILATDPGSLPERCVVTRPGVRTRSTLAIALGAAEHRRTRRAVIRETVEAVLHLKEHRTTREVLTPVLADPLSVVPFIAVLGSLIVRPGSVARFARDAVGNYAVSPDAIDRLRSELRR